MGAFQIFPMVSVENENGKKQKKEARRASFFCKSIESAGIIPFRF
jgi:hypothetical protein